MNTLLPERMGRFAAALVGVLTLSLVVAQAGWKVGDVLPDLAAQKLEGKLPDSLKGKVVLVDFWASWCVPCAESFPALEELHQRYKDRGLVILAVSTDEERAKMEKFLKKHPVTFAVVRDAGQKLVAQADVSTMPTSFLVDAEGKVRFIHAGFHGEKTRKQYAEEIESLLKTKP